MKHASIALLALCLPSFAAAAMPSCPATVPAPLPATVPAPEMRHAAPVASCLEINAVAYVQRLRQPAPVAPAAASSTDGYVQKTQFDNTPWRFDMNQNGRRMTAEEFDAWMKAKGIRVATGKPGGSAQSAPAAPAPAAPAAPAMGCQASEAVTC